jgi:hypothetical protein
MSFLTVNKDVAMSNQDSLTDFSDLIEDENWKAVVLMAQNKGVDEAIKTATRLLSKSTYLLVPSTDPHRIRELAVIELIISNISNMALMSQSPTDNLVDLFCLAVDMGFHDQAYNAANGVFERASCVDDYKRAQSYFKIAIATIQDPSLKAAALVNYCPILRDGLISGKPDLPAAIETYEKAAKLGLIQAMFNVANVCMWQINKGNGENIEKARFWINVLIEKIELNENFLEMDDQSLFPDISGQALYWLARYNLDGLIEGASLTEGIRLLKKSIAITTKDCNKKNWNLECAYSQKIMLMSGQDYWSLGHRWQEVLSALDWPVRLSMRIDGIDADIINVIGSKLNFHIIILGSVFFPDGFYRELFSLDMLLSKQGIVNYLVFSPYALSMKMNENILMPVTLMLSGARYLMGLNLVETIDDQVAAVAAGREATDVCNLFTSQVLPMVINSYINGQAIDNRELTNLNILLLNEKWCLPYSDVEPSFSLLR